jgi:hypothetical protein
MLRGSTYHPSNASDENMAWKEANQRPKAEFPKYKECAAGKECREGKCGQSSSHDCVRVILSHDVDYLCRQDVEERLMIS